MFKKSLNQLRQDLQARNYSSLELTTWFLERIQTYQTSLNCFISIDEQLAKAQAQQADKLIAQNLQGPLTGIPIAHKDIFCTQGMKTSCGSKMLDNFFPPYSATTVSRLEKAGMITLGKTNMDEFAMGSSNETSFYGPCKNPWDITRSPGGSSGGSAAAVSAGLAPCATGTDTGGSIRQPAAFCGITGLKPTYGRLSRHGMVAFASSLDVGGPMAKSAEDLALMLSVMAGQDPNDVTSALETVPNYKSLLNQSLQGLKIGIAQNYFDEALPDEIKKATFDTTHYFEKAGASLVDIALPEPDDAIACYYIIAPAECSSNLARFDGLRFGHQPCQPYENLEDYYLAVRTEGFGEEVKRRLLIGTHVLSAGYMDAYYVKAQKIRRMIRDSYLKIFQEVDIILTPTTPSTAFLLGEKDKSATSRYLADKYTVGISLAGLPALSMPVGFDSHGLPIGAQLVGAHFSEATLLNVAYYYQQQTDFHLAQPQI